MHTVARASQLHAFDVRIRMQDGRCFHYTALASSSVDAVMAAINRFGLCKVSAMETTRPDVKKEKEE